MSLKLKMLRLLLLSSVTGGVMGQPTYDVSPLHIPLRDVQILPDTDAFLRGIPAKIGTPAQNVVLLPWAGFNNTWIYDAQTHCNTNAENDDICHTHQGNLFRLEDSSTYRNAGSITDSGMALEEGHIRESELGTEGLAPTSLGGIDNLQISSSPLLDHFPFGITQLPSDAGYARLHGLGLGSNSTYMNALRSTGRIPSRVWSLFWGRVSIDEPLDGSVVLGGYDEDKVTGQNYTAPLIFGDDETSSSCWTGMMVAVSDIKLNFRDGRDVSLFPGNGGLSFCLAPQENHLLKAPKIYVSDFEALTQTKSLRSSDDVPGSSKFYNSKEAFDGDITISLPSGLDIKVPNSQYMTPFVDIERKGSRIFQNETRELLIHSASGQIATLGSYFFTAAYLMVNHDAGTFTLWKAKPSKKTTLVRVSNKDAYTRRSKSSVGSLVSRDVEQASVSGGVIGGAVAGSLVGVGAIAAAIFFLLRQKKKSNAKQQSNAMWPSDEIRPSNSIRSSNAMRPSSTLRDLPRASGGDKFPFEPQQMSPTESRHFSPFETNNVPQELYGSEPVSIELRRGPGLVFELEAGERR